MDRYVHEFDDQFVPRDTPFDPEKHEWEKERVRWIDGSDVKHYPKAVCFRAAEEVLEGMNLPPDSRLIEIQNGAQQAIFLATAWGQRFVVGVSRASVFNEMVRVDHDGIVAMRALEKRDGAKFSFPEHYAAQSTSVGPFTWVSAFCDGYHEVNLDCTDDSKHSFMGDTNRRRIVRNRKNHGEVTELSKEEDSEDILTVLAEHQLRTAHRARRLLVPAFRAGDYMYDFESGRPMMQCYRAPRFAPLTGQYFGSILQRIEGNCPEEWIFLAGQLTYLLFHRERNLLTREGRDNSREFFSYSATSVASALSRLKKDSGFLSPQGWATVTQIFDFVKQAVVHIPLQPVQDQRLLQARVGFVEMLLRQP